YTVDSPVASAYSSDGSLVSAVSATITPSTLVIVRQRSAIMPARPSDPRHVGAEQRLDLRQLVLVDQEHDHVVVGLDHHVMVGDQQLVAADDAADRRRRRQFELVQR